MLRANKLGDPFWAGRVGDLPELYSGVENSSVRTALQSRSLTHDYFPHGGFVGAGYIDVPRALYDNPPQELYTALNPASNAVARYFPEGTRMTKPRGGYMLWVELPPNVDGFCVYREALQRHISIMPGTIFSPDNRFRNHIRISCNQPWYEKQDHALQVLGEICKQAARSSA